MMKIGKTRRTIRRTIHGSGAWGVSASRPRAGRARMICLSLGLLLALSEWATAFPALADPAVPPVGALGPADHGPIGVMGDHFHQAGEVMLSYRYGHMDMNDTFSGDDKISTAAVLADFSVAPVRMSMDMHMFGAMYAPDDRVTLMVMLPYVEREMDHLAMGGAVAFTTRSRGIGDLTLGGLVPLWQAPGHSLHLNAGIGLPTGSIDEKGRTPMGRVVLPYPMQPGSGTASLRPGLTYAGFDGSWSWGAQAAGILYLGRNSEGYSLGDTVEGTLWGARTVASWASLSLRLLGKSWANIDGADRRLVPAMVPTADPARRGGNRLDAFLGMNVRLPSAVLSGLGTHRLAVEIGLPLAQHLDGPQLGADWQTLIGWQASF